MYPQQPQHALSILINVLAFSFLGVTQQVTPGVTTLITTTLWYTPTPTIRPPQTTVIEVGKGERTFKPEIVQAAVGDIIEFRFFPVNHSVVRANYLR